MNKKNRYNNPIILDPRGGWLPFIDLYECPSCGEIVIDTYDKECCECGQKIIWKEIQHIPYRKIIKRIIDEKI